MMCDCIEKMKEEWKKEYVMLDVEFDNAIGDRLLIPFTYSTLNEKTGELCKKRSKGNYIPMYCPFCGKKLKDATK
jgi:hypothetical protein